MTHRRLIGLIGLLVVLDLVLWSAITPMISYWKHTIGLTKPEAGVASGIYSGAIVLLSIPAGRLADRVGAKPVTLAATLLFAITAPLTGFADAVWQVIILRFVQGSFSAVAWSAGLAWLASAVGPSERARAIGLINALVPVGMVGGPALGGPAVDQFGPKATFIGFGVIVLVLLAMLAMQPDAEATHDEHLSLKATAKLAVRDSWLFAANASIFVLAFGQTLLQTLAPLHLDAAGIGQDRIGYLFMATASMSLLATVVTARLQHRVASLRPRFVLWGITIAGATAALFTLPLAVPLYCAVAIAYSAPQSVAFTSSYALAGDGAARSGVGQGVAMATLSTFWGIGAAISPTLLAPLAQATSDGVVFGLLSIAMLISAVWLFRAVRTPVRPTM